MSKFNLLIKPIEWWTSVLALVLVIFMSLFAFVARRPLCIDSRTVEKIDVQISSDKQVSIFRCSTLRRVDYHPRVVKIINEINRRLPILERSLVLLGNFQKDIQINIVLDSIDDARVKTRSGLISGTEKAILAKGSLEKLILKAWILDQIPESFYDLSESSRILSLEVQSDLLLYSLFGEFNFYEPRTQIEVTRESLVRWPFTLEKGESYCIGPWRSLESYKICENLGSSEMLHLLSSRSFLSEVLMASYDSLSRFEKIKFIESYKDLIKDAPFSRIIPIKDFSTLKNYEISSSSFVSIKNEVDQFLNLYLKASEKLSSVHEFSFNVNKNLKKMGYFLEEDQFFVDTLAILENKNTAFFHQIKNHVFENSDSFQAIEVNGQVFMTRQMDPFVLSDLGRIIANRGIIVRCKLPLLEDIAALEPRFEKIIFVKNCGERLAQLELLMSGKLKEFAKKNPEVRLAHFHIPSLKMALQKMPSNEIYIALTQKRWEELKKIGFGIPELNKEDFLFEADSEIQFVNSFRL